MFVLCLVISILTLIFSIVYSHLLNKSEKNDYQFHIRHAIFSLITAYLGQLIVNTNTTPKSGYLRQVIKTGNPNF